MYEADRLSAVQAQRRAQEIAFGPVVFQVSRLMLKFGILRMLDDHKEGLSARGARDLRRSSPEIHFFRACPSGYT